MVSWYLGVGFMVFWSYGLIVSWLYGFTVCIVFWFYGFKVSGFQNYKNHFIFVDRDWSHTNLFKMCLDGSSGFCGAHPFPNR